MRTLGVVGKEKGMERWEWPDGVRPGLPLRNRATQHAHTLCLSVRAACGREGASNQAHTTHL